MLNILCGGSFGGIKHETTYIFAGICFLTVYAQIWSIFAKVGLGANLVLILLCIFLGVVQKKYLMSRIREMVIWTKRARFVTIIVLILLFAFGTSHGIMHYDSDLYHAQSIRWIEEYGVVPGLGNIHSRLAYNSSSFCLSALLSMRFLGGKSYHACTGFLALLIAINCIDLFKKDEVLLPKLSNVVRAVAIYYLLMIFDEMVSPASDYFMVLLTIELVLSYTELIERRMDNESVDTSQFALLSLLALVILTVKISGAFVVLVVIYPVYLYLKACDVRSIIKYLSVGFVTVLPFVIRNIILSGYLVYPFPSVDVFNFDFKIPKGVAEYDAKEIQVYGRGYADVLRFDEPMGKWFPDWFGGLDVINKISFIMAATGLLVMVALIVYYLVKKAYFVFPQLLIVAVVEVSFVFWVMTSPNIRYGCIFLYLAAALSWGWVYVRLGTRLDRGIVLKIVLIVFLCYKTGMFVYEMGCDLERIISKGQLVEYLVSQQDYGQYECISYDIRLGEDIEDIYGADSYMTDADMNVTEPDREYIFYRPVIGDRTGYWNFPGTVVIPDVRLRGENISDGFLAGKKEY